MLQYAKLFQTGDSAESIGNITCNFKLTDEGTGWCAGNNSLGQSVKICFLNLVMEIWHSMVEGPTGRQLDLAMDQMSTVSGSILSSMGACLNHGTSGETVQLL